MEIRLHRHTWLARFGVRPAGIAISAGIEVVGDQRHRSRSPDSVPNETVMVSPFLILPVGTGFRTAYIVGHSRQHVQVLFIPHKPPISPHSRPARTKGRFHSGTRVFSMTAPGKDAHSATSPSTVGGAVAFRMPNTAATDVGVDVGVDVGTVVSIANVLSVGGAGSGRRTKEAHKNQEGRRPRLQPRGAISSEDVFRCDVPLRCPVRSAEPGRRRRGPRPSSRN